MNTTMADGASERLDAQIADALFGQPGMSKLDVANQLRLLRGNGKPLLCGNCYGLGVIGYTSGQTPEQFEQGEYPCPDCAQPSPADQGDEPWPEIDLILADAYSAGAEGLQFEGIARRAAVRAAIAGNTSHQSEYLHGSDELRARVAGERAAYLEGLNEGKLIAARQPDTDEQYANEQALIDHLDGLMDDGGQGREKWPPAQAAIAGIIAARHPVGHELVQQNNAPAVVPYQRAHALLGDAYNAGTQGVGFGDQAEALFDAMMAAPPAQAVGLGGIREMLHGWKNSDYPLSYEGQCAQRALDACIADLQGWIDSKVVGNG